MRATAPGITNSVGNLGQHLCGNLQHFIGAVLGSTGYVRNRESSGYWARSRGEKVWSSAYIAGLMGASAGAVRFLEQSRVYGLGEYRFTHREPAFAAMRHYLPFQRFLKSRD